ncbi:MAG TPA: hypothetical protein VMT00_10200 [Thermoanaerobaculia bacterium]|nr:hypothetical protein [Thermoanaerobaculia bacterium]
MNPTTPRHFRALAFGLTTALVFVCMQSANLEAACINKYIYKSQGNRQHITLLTGKLTFQDAQELARQIAEKKSPPLEWLDDKGKTLATQFGELKVVRPMPISCDDKPSGVVVATTFMTMVTPSRSIQIRLGPDTVVTFEEQKQ